MPRELISKKIYIILKKFLIAKNSDIYYNSYWHGLLLCLGFKYFSKDMSPFQK